MQARVSNLQSVNNYSFATCAEFTLSGCANSSWVDKQGRIHGLGFTGPTNGSLIKIAKYTALLSVSHTGNTIHDSIHCSPVRDPSVSGST